MNLRDLQYLVAVADLRHFGRAAEASFVSQPTLSAQIKKLETELGVELIERNPRSITLTAAGLRVTEHARIVLAEVETIRGIAAMAIDPEGGSLRLGIFPTLAPYLLPHVVAPIHERFPNLELLLVEEKTDVLVERLHAGELDVGLMAMPIQDTLLSHEVLFTEDFVLAVPTAHPLASHAGQLPMSTLATEHLLLLEEGHCLRDQALEICRLTGAAERRGFRATSLETLRQMVVADVGITLLPELSVQPPIPRSNDITLIGFTDPAPQRAIAMFWRPTSVFRDLIPVLAELIRNQIGPLVGHGTALAD